MRVIIRALRVVLALALVSGAVYVAAMAVGDPILPVALILLMAIVLPLK